MRAATVVQVLRDLFKFYCMFYFTCDRSFRSNLEAGDTAVAAVGTAAGEEEGSIAEVVETVAVQDRAAAVADAAVMADMEDDTVLVYCPLMNRQAVEVQTSCTETPKYTMQTQYTQTFICLNINVNSASLL